MALRDFFRLDDDHPFTGRHMLAVVLLFFGVIISVNVVMAVAATGTFPGLIVKNSYVASQNYNDVLASARTQARSGWAMELSAPAGRLEIRLSRGDGAPVDGLEVTAIAGRPSSTRYDQVIAFAGSGGLYRAAKHLDAGQWEVDVEARRDGALVFRDRRRLFISPGAL